MLMLHVVDESLCQHRGRTSRSGLDLPVKRLLDVLFLLGLLLDRFQSGEQELGSRDGHVAVAHE